MRTNTKRRASTKRITATGVGSATKASITLNGDAVDVQAGEWLISECERAGVYIPRFCYHERMESVGMCRMCIVEVDTGRGMSLQPSCMLKVADNMKVRTDTDAVKKAQNGVLEFLLLNHPLDCPVCDKGGECPLQDQTIACGPGESRFVEEKRHFEKPIAISSNVYLDRERCILCDRCTRFADQVAGDPLIHFMGRGAHSEVNTFPEEPFSSYFSGNTVQICPVGALTAVPYRFKARPWDLTESLSTAWVDTVGSRVNVQASRNQVVRLQGVDSDNVNWGWLSDKERFAFEALNCPERVHSPLVRLTDVSHSENSVSGGVSHSESGVSHGEVFTKTSWSTAIHKTVTALCETTPERVGVLGGARCTNEAQYAWAKLFKGVVGTDNVDCQLNDGINPKLLLGLPRATINDACRPSSTVILIGPDPKEELGSLYLRLRHAVIKDNMTLIEIQPCDGGMSHLAAHTLRPKTGETSLLVRSLVVTALSFLRADGSEPGDVAGVNGESIAEAARAVAKATGGVTVVLGRFSLAESAKEIEESAAMLRMLPFARFLYALRRGNVHGALDAGLSPGLLPGRRNLMVGPGADELSEPLSRFWPALPKSVGLDAQGILSASAEGKIDVLILIGVDPLNDFVDRGLAERGLRRAGCVVAVDMFVNDSAMLAADVVLAASGPTESEGTFTNLEGRVSSMSQSVTPPGVARADWMIATELSMRVAHAISQAYPFSEDHPFSQSAGVHNFNLVLDSSQAVRQEMSQISEIHKLIESENESVYDVEGCLLTGTRIEPPSPRLGLARPVAVASQNVSDSSRGAVDTSSRGSVELRLITSRVMYDDGVMLRHCVSSRDLAKPCQARVHPDDMKRLSSADGMNLTEGSLVKIASVNGHVHASIVSDIGIPSGSITVPWISPSASANTLIAGDSLFTVVSVEPIEPESANDN